MVPIDKIVGSCLKPSEGIGICIARCTDDNDCEGDLKCCGDCPRDCVHKKYIEPLLFYSISM